VKRWAILVLICAIPALTFLLQKFPPSLEEVTQNIISLSLGNTNSPIFTKYLLDSGRQLFLLPEFFKSWLPDDLIYSHQLHRLPNLFLSLVCILLFYRLTQNKLIAVFMLAITPWFIYESVFDFTGLLTLFLALLLFIPKPKISNIFVLIFLSLTSLLGLVTALVFSISQIKDKTYFVSLIFVLCILIFRSPVTQLKSLTFFGRDDYSLNRAGFEVDQRVREETRFNNHIEHIPLIFKRVSYNKYFFWITRIAPQFTKVLNWEYLSSPAQINTTVSKNLWGEKRISLIFFWQLALAVIGLLSFRNINGPEQHIIKILLIAAIISTGLSDIT
jgi:hypothetical protein